MELQRAGYLNENYHYFHLRDTAGQERDFHFHEFDKLVILVEGNVQYILEGSEFPLCPRDVLLVRHHCIHKAVIDRSEPYERVILYLDRAYYERVLPDAHLMECFDRADAAKEYLFKPDERQWNSLFSLCMQLESEEKTYGAGSPMCDTLVSQLLITLGRLLPAEHSRSAQIDQKIMKTLSYIDENLASDLSVDTLASKVWLSRYHFMRLFKSQTGRSVHEYVRERRLLQAARMIREGVSAVQAASVCGFQDYSAFHRAFVSVFSFPPGRLKKQRR